MNRKYYRFLGASGCFALTACILPMACGACDIYPNPESAIRPANSDSASLLLGTTPTDIKSRFAGVIEQNFRTGDANTIIHNLSPMELADLATVYGANTGGATSTLVNILAAKVDAAGLNAVASAFGRTQVSAAVAHYAPANIAAQFSSEEPIEGAAPSASVAMAVKGSSVQSNVATPMAVPTTDMTPTEIYLEFRTAPVGSLGVASSLYEAATFIASRVAVAFGVGYATGTYVNDLIETYDPDLEDAIGGTVDQMLTNITAATDEFSQGNVESGMDSLFGGGAQTVPDDSGNDYGVTVPLQYYTIISGGC